MHATFVAHFRARAAAYGDARSCTYYRDVGLDLAAETVTYRELDRQARAIAAWLSTRPETNRPVLLLYPDSADFLPALLGCLYAGVVAVPAPVPHGAQGTQRVAGILVDSGSRLVLTAPALAHTVEEWIRDSDCPATVTVAATHADLGDENDWRMPRIDGGTVAYLQYTSGSTGSPKGVIVTHANLMHNEATIAEALGAHDGATSVQWLPHFHDMGLVGMLQPLFSGANLAFMSPMAFLKRPVRWLELVLRHRAEFTVAPNFAYDLIVRRVTESEAAALDLSSLRVALNGAEPIRPRTLTAMVDRFGAVGFRAETLVTAYGMAEATLMVTAHPVGSAPRCLDIDPVQLERHRAVPAGDRGAVRLVSSGTPRNAEVLVVDPDTGEVLPDNRVGEIWVRGRSVAVGYFGNARETAARFDARAHGSGPFLRTGDLGLTNRGHLFVTGRLDDLVIVNGRNLYPQDIEDVVGQVHPALAGTAGVAVSVDCGHRERLVVIQGVRDTLLDGLALEELTARVRAAVARAFDLPAPEVVLVERRGIHRTTSGKVQRRSMRKSFLENRIRALHECVDPSVQRLRAR